MNPEGTRLCKTQLLQPEPLPALWERVGSPEVTVSSAGCRATLQQLKSV